MLFTLTNVPFKTADDVVREMLRQMYEVFPQADFPKLRFELSSTGYTNKRRVLIKDILSTGKNVPDYSLWVNPTLAKMLSFGQDPNDPLPEKFLITGGGRTGTLQDLQNLKPSPTSILIPTYLTTPFVCLGKTVSEKNAINLDASALVVTSGLPQFQRFHVYVDFIVPRIAGGIRTGLLCTVPNPGLDVRLTSASYAHEVNSPLYLRTENTIVQSFTFVVRDDDGNVVDFAWGSTGLELHFRRYRGPRRDWHV